jgi:uncharacterized protein (DUF2141 family)
MNYFIASLISIVSLFQTKEFDLSVELKGLDSKKGNIRIALYRENDNFPSVNKNYKNKVQEASSAEIVFKNLPSNVYAFAVYHDENANGMLDKNMFGVPTEKYAFSNNARETFSAPSFKSASFDLNQNKKVKVTLK